MTWFYSSTRQQAVNLPELNLLDISLTEAALYLLTGAFSGIAAGLLGIGGGLIIVPVLYFVFSTHGYDQQYVMHMALATSLATIIITSISSTLAHHRKNAVLWPITFLLAPGICLGAWLGASFAAELQTAVLRPVFGVFELLVAALMFSQYQSRQHQTSIKPGKAFLGGSIIGGISAIVGIGGGTLTVPFLHWHNINIKNAVATSAACGLPIAVFGTASYIYSGWILTETFEPPENTVGYVQIHAFILIAICSFIFAPLGAQLAHKISEPALKKVFAVLLLLLGLKMLFL